MTLMANGPLQELLLLLFPLCLSFVLLIFKGLEKKTVANLLLVGGQLAWAGLAVYLYLSADLGVELLPGTTFSWQLDKQTLFLQLAVSLISASGFIFSLGYMNRDSSPRRFLALLLLEQLAALLVVVADHIWLLWSAMAIYTVLSGALVAYYYGDLDKVQRAIRSFVVAGIGMTAFLGLTFLVLKAGGRQSLAELAADPVALAPYRQALTWLFLVFIACQFTQFPCHIWVCEPAAAPSPATALLQGGLAVLLCSSLVGRCLFMLDLSLFRLVILAIAIPSLLIAAVYGLLQWNIKRLLSYFCMNRLSFLLLLLTFLPREEMPGAVLLLAAALLALYLAVAIVIRQLGDQQQLEMLGCLYRRLPVLAAAVAVILFLLLPWPFSPMLHFSQQVVTALWALAGQQVDYYGAYYVAAGCFLLSELVLAGVAARCFLRLFVKEPVLVMPAPEEGLLPWQMAGAFGLSLLLAVLAGVGGYHFPGSALWYSLPVCLGTALAALFLFRPARHYFPGHYRALKHERFLSESGNRLLIKPILLLSEVVLKHFIGQWLPAFCKKFISYLVRISGYGVQLLHRGDMRYYLALFFLGLLVILCSLEVG